MTGTRKLAIGTLFLAAVVAVCLPQPGAVGQGIEAEELSAEVLQRDIQFLQMLTSLQFTADQRAAAAKAIEACDQKRAAAERLAEPPELLSALSALREALLKGQTPTPAMREAVETARPRDPAAIEKAFADAQEGAVTALESILTADQKEQLRILSLIGVAEDLIAMCMHSREVEPAEGQEMRLSAFPEVRDRLAAAAGDGAEKALSDFQSLINRIAAQTPEQVDPQRQQLIAQVVTLLKTNFDKSPEMEAERLRNQLWGWVTEPRVHLLLSESAAGMGAQ